MLDNVLTYKRSNARVSHRVIERVSKYKQESASFSKGCRKVGETYTVKSEIFARLLFREFSISELLASS